MSDSKKMKTLSAHLVAKSKGELVLPSEVMKSIRMLAPEAVLTLEALMKTGSSDSVKLKAALEILALGGINKESKITITTDVQDLDSAGLDMRLQELLGDATGFAGSLIVEKIHESEITDIVIED